MNMGTSLDFKPSQVPSSIEKMEIEGTDSPHPHTDSVLQQTIDAAFLKLGRVVVARPWQVIMSSIIFGLICFLGVFSPNMYYESRGEYLWVPINSLAFKTFQYDQKVFPQSYYHVVLVQPKDNDVNFLTKSVFDDLWYLDTLIQDITLDNGLSYTDLCLSYNGTCEQFNPLQFWTDYNSYNTSVKTDSDIVDVLSTLTFANGFVVSPTSLFGNYVIDSNGDLGQVEGSNMVYQINSDLVSDEEAQEWEDAFLKVCGLKGAPANPRLKQPFDSIYVLPYGDRSLDAEMTRVVTVDIPLVMTEYVVMFLFLAVALSYGQPNTKVSQAAGTVMSVTLSTMAGYGVCAACGIPMTQLVFILPFILVGIGVDDAVVIITSYRHIETSIGADDEDGGIGARVATAVGRCALSIIYTTLTDVVAFSLGCLGTIPAIRYFCAYAAIAVAFDFMFQITFFVAILVIDERRSLSQSKTNEVIKSDDNDYEKCVSPTAVSPESNSQDNSNENNLKSRKQQTEEFAEKYVNAITSKPGITVIFLMYFGLVAWSGWALTNLTEDFDVSTVVPDDSYTREYFTESQKVGLFWDSYIPYRVYFKGSRDISDPQVQADAAELLTDLSENTKRSEGPVSWWMDSFLDWSSNQTEYQSYITSAGYFDGTSTVDAQTAFEGAVSKFLSTSPYDRYSTSVVLRDDGSVRASRATLYHFKVKTAEDKIVAMNAAYEKCEDSTLGINNAVPYTNPYVFITQFSVIYQETILNLCLSFVAVAIISMPILQSFRALFVVLVCVAAIDVDLLGLIWGWGLDLNSLSMLSLVMAIGLVVDYIAHIVHYFMVHSDIVDPKARMVAALAEVGGAVAIGGLTTFVGVLPLSLASSFVYRLFFKLFLSIVTLGLFHGLVVAPLFMILIFPNSVTTTKESSWWWRKFVIFRTLSFLNFLSP
mmetsp:Transcript_54018/g.69363  ORF Transcript_54018/g.69363 Transcript_54018/m.69363 type:complete len:930 (+) Transcript_54018:98-2887(+)